jgi:pimeloyl-ACP methyl ester carboxylesterase
MTHEWEKPVGAVLDYFELDTAALVGISLGGYLALRAAAFEPRITQVAAWGIIYDALECWIKNIPPILRGWFTRQLRRGRRRTVNAFFGLARKRNDLLDWGLDHGMYITGAASPYDYFKEWTNYSMKLHSRLVRQDVLLLAGENDHFVPLEMYYRQKEALTAAKSVHGRIFRADEGGDQHCQVGALDLALEEIVRWLDDRRQNGANA